MGGGNLDDAAEADVLEQRQAAAPGDGEPDPDEMPVEADVGDAGTRSSTPPEVAPRELPLEADPEDVAEQRREVGGDDAEDYLH
jgi:hypothetical protein